jgi:hypothetical protein
MFNDFRNAGELLHEILIISVALFFPLAIFFAIAGL